jgi:hypothetical protein
MIRNELRDHFQANMELKLGYGFSPLLGKAADTLPVNAKLSLIEKLCQLAGYANNKQYGKIYADI